MAVKIVVGVAAVVAALSVGSHGSEGYVGAADDSGCGVVGETAFGKSGVMHGDGRWRQQLLGCCNIARPFGGYSIITYDGIVRYRW